VNQVAKVLTPENKDELLPRFFHLSRRHAEQLAVSLRPVEVIAVREVVTAIRLAPAAARAAAITPPAPEGGETRFGGTDRFQLHPGEAAAEVDGSPAADASPSMNREGARRRRGHSRPCGRVGCTPGGPPRRATPRSRASRAPIAPHRFRLSAPVRSPPLVSSLLETAHPGIQMPDSTPVAGLVINR
jgi:hypothetical protein